MSAESIERKKVSYQRIRQELIALHRKQNELASRGLELTDREKRRVQWIESKLLDVGQNYIIKIRKLLSGN